MRYAFFCLVLLGLGVAIGAGGYWLSRHGVGTPVFAGMIAASAVGIFIIPMLYVTFQTLRERTSARFRRGAREQSAENA